MPERSTIGELLGTPLYMAPEQFRARRADAQTDQFSFCVALYQALYGVHPFRHATMADLVNDVSRGAVQPAPAAGRGRARPKSTESILYRPQKRRTDKAT